MNEFIFGTTIIFTGCPPVGITLQNNLPIAFFVIQAKTHLINVRLIIGLIGITIG